MNKKYPNYTVCVRMPRILAQKLKQRQGKRQTMAGVIEDLLEEIEGLQDKRDPLIDKIAKLQYDLDYFEQQNINTDLLAKLEKRRHPFQSIGGVITELIETAEKVRMGDFRLYDKPSGEG